MEDSLKDLMNRIENLEEKASNLCSLNSAMEDALYYGKSDAKSYAGAVAAITEMLRDLDEELQDALTQCQDIRKSIKVI